jgi:Zn-dependent protease
MHFIKQKAYGVLWLVIPILGGFIYPLVRETPEFLKWFTIGVSVYVLFFSVVVHELCHGIGAAVCGDTTAQEAERLTLNPVRHFSPVGSLAVPLVLYLFNASVIFGWAKPVPFNPMRLKHHPRDQVLLALAGPFSNFLLSYVCFTLFLICGLIFNRFFPESPVTFQMGFEPIAVGNVPFAGFWFMLFQILTCGMLFNVFLGVFNLVPFPPLDGFWVFRALVPKKVSVFLGKVQMFGFVLLFIALHFNLLQVFFYPVLGVLGLYGFVFESCQM